MSLVKSMAARTLGHIDHSREELLPELRARPTPEQKVAERDAEMETDLSGRMYVHRATGVVLSKNTMFEFALSLQHYKGVLPKGNPDKALKLVMGARQAKRLLKQSRRDLQKV